MSDQLELDLDFGGPRVPVRRASSFVRSPQGLVERFHTATSSAVNHRNPDVVALRHRLVREECLELLDELSEVLLAMNDGRHVTNWAKVAKELGDLLYVAYGTAVSLGINAQEAFRRVHDSNMSKLVGGKAILREDGKVLKGENYFEPDMTGTYREETT
jgi:NTP pyrophosphatase (non-canonical NTP hydrolase)